MALVVGLILIASSILMYVLGHPKEGQIRPFLRRDGMQAIYAVAMVALGSAGAILIVNSLARAAG